LVVAAGGRVVPVQPRHQAMRLGFAGGRNKFARSVRKQIGDRRRCAGEHDRAAVLRRQKRGVPIFHAVRRKPAVIGQDDKRGQIVVERTETLARPAACAGKSRKLKTRRLQQRGRTVHAGFADHVVHERQIVDDRPEGRDDVAQQFPRLAVRMEIAERAQTRPESVLKRLDGLAEIAGPAVALGSARV